MPKIVVVSIALAILSAVAPALAQGFPGSLPQTVVWASAVYGQNHSGWLSALLFGSSSGSQGVGVHRQQPEVPGIIICNRAPKEPALA